MRLSTSLWQNIFYCAAKVWYAHSFRMPNNEKNKEAARELFINAVTLITKFESLQKELCKQCQSQYNTAPKIDVVASGYANELSLSVSVSQVIRID